MSKIVDPRRLEDRARGREDGEAIEIVFESSGIRAIVGVRLSEMDAGTLFIEISSSPGELSENDYEHFIERQAQLESELTALGYSSFRDDMTLIAELVTLPHELAADLRHVCDVIDGTFPRDATDLVGQ